MRILSGRVKRHPVLATVLAWLIVMTPVGMTAEAAFHLEYVDEPTKGLSFMPEVIGLRTTPAPSYTPLRASGAAQGPSVRIVEPRPSGRCHTATGTPPQSVLDREVKGVGYSPTAYNLSGSGANGCWQFMDGTWAGYKGYAHAADAPIDVQNERAAQVWNGGQGCGHWASCG